LELVELVPYYDTVCTMCQVLAFHIFRKGTQLSFAWVHIAQLRLTVVLRQTVSFVPLDVAAKAIADMRDSPTQILHLAHPSPVPWNSLIQPTADILSVPLVYYHDWVSRLERIDDDENSDEYPSALRLLDFFQRSDLDGSPGGPSASSEVMGFPTLSMKRSIEYLPRLSEMRGIVGEVGKWLEYWKMP